MATATAARDAERTRAEILRVATEVFAEVGYSGARVDDIAARTRTTKRMIYYYYGDKAGLYTSVLERVYEDIRTAEQAVDLTGLGPREALARVVESGIAYHAAHPELGRLVAIENVHHAEHLGRSTRQAALNTPIIELLEQILERGRAEGVFRRDATALEVHLMAMALAIFPVTNRSSIAVTFGYDMGEPDHAARLREMAVAAVLAWLCDTSVDPPA